jgi:hypothetical protein
MINSPSLSRSTRLLIIGNLCLAVVIAIQLLLPSEQGTANAAVSADSSSALPEFGSTSIAAPPIAQFVDMLERPLFTPDRRMPEPEVEKVAPPPPRPLQLKLEGIAIAGSSRVAVLRNMNGNILMQLAEGDSHEGWTLDTLTSTSAKFSRDGGQVNELLLDPDSKSRR